jgi:hypothetical protein
LAKINLPLSYFLRRRLDIFCFTSSTLRRPTALAELIADCTKCGLEKQRKHRIAQEAKIMGKSKTIAFSIVKINLDKTLRRSSNLKLCQILYFLPFENYENNTCRSHQKAQFCLCLITSLKNDTIEHKILAYLSAFGVVGCAEST